ncbi:hypothetical protein RZS08_53375, partial [Arthrospira platensis SPKY1]|nr:hypothetical protein [Arthrospira platensis SPKY1]
GSWVLPYAAIGWMVSHHPGDSFLGNPRISFQHQATRGVALRHARRQARAWAAWAAVCKADTTLQPDIGYEFHEPGLDEIRTLLERHGLPGEAALWERAMKSEI